MSEGFEIKKEAFVVLALGFGVRGSVEKIE